MNRGLYIGATSLLANERKLNVIANNLANVNTTGYKKDIALLESFDEKLLTKINDKSTTVTILDNNNIAYEADGQTHIARANNGYFRVSSPLGISYVKEIQFTVNEEGFLRTYYRDEVGDLKTDNEHYILDNNGDPIQVEDEDIETLLETNIYYPPSHVIGTMSAGVNFKKIVTDFSQGEIVETGGSYDLALDSSGFFKVMDQDGNTYYTRDGSFTLNQNGQLVTSTGQLVQGIDGPIYIEGDSVTIDKSGQVYVDDNIVGVLDVVDLENKEFLRKIGDNLYTMAEGVEAEEIPYGGNVLKGYLESSNVNAIDEMVEMITLLREFETSQKVIRAQDEMLEKAVTEIGRI